MNKILLYGESAEEYVKNDLTDADGEIIDPDYSEAWFKSANGDRAMFPRGFNMVGVIWAKSLKGSWHCEIFCGKDEFKKKLCQMKLNFNIVYVKTCGNRRAYA